MSDHHSAFPSISVAAAAMAAASNSVAFAAFHDATAAAAATTNHATTTTATNDNSMDEFSITEAMVTYLRTEADRADDKAKRLRKQAAEIAERFGITEESQQTYGAFVLCFVAVVVDFIRFGCRAFYHSVFALV